MAASRCTSRTMRSSSGGFSSTLKTSRRTPSCAGRVRPPLASEAWRRLVVCGSRTYVANDDWRVCSAPAGPEVSIVKRGRATSASLVVENFMGDVDKTNAIIHALGASNICVPPLLQLRTELTPCHRTPSSVDQDAMNYTQTRCYRNSRSSAGTSTCP